MGAYLTKPNREKVSEDSENYRFAVGASSMQGWRLSQEDAHNAILTLEPGIAYFGVYDGHGGHEVAGYTALYLPKFIKDSQEFKDGLYEKALEECFIRFDETLTQPEVKALMCKVEVDGADPDEVDHLYKEATMPIEDVIARFQEGVAECTAVKNKNMEMVAGECSSSSGNSNKQPQSPLLSAKRGATENKHIRFEENGEEVKNRAGSCLDENKNGEKEHSNGSGEASNGKEVSQKEEEDHSSTATNGGNSQKPIAKGKGKGKGKGKSNQIAKTEEEEAQKEEVEESPKKPKKSAEELYQNMLADGEGDSSDEDDDDDDDAFPNVNASSDDDDEDDDDEDDDDDELEGEEDSEPDTEDDEDDDEDEDEADCSDGMIKEEEPGKDSGCTAVVGLIVKNELFVANAGDSRCVVCRNGEAIDMSMDHKPEDEPEKTRIEKAGGNVTADGRVDGGLNLSRALGDHAYKLNASLPLIEQMISPQPDIKTLKLNPKTDSFIILACDGIWNSMSSQEVVDFIKPRIEKSPGEISSICEELFDACLAPDTSGDGTGCDNMTAVIIKIKDSYNSKSEPSSSSSFYKRPSDTDTPATSSSSGAANCPKKLKTDPDAAASSLSKH